MMNNGISPKVGLWFNFIVLVLTGVAAGSLNLSGIPDTVVTATKIWAGNAAWVIGVANMVFGLYSANTAGPLVKQ